MSQYDYYYGTLTGTIDAESSTLSYLVDNLDSEAAADEEDGEESIFESIEDEIGG